MRVLDALQTRAALPMDDAIEAMRDAFSSRREVPHRIGLGRSLFMPGRVGAASGIKVVGTTPGKPEGIVAVFDEHGTPIGVVDGPTLTAIRTGAASGLATELLAPADASSLAMLGAGAMAADQIEAIRSVRPIAKVTVWSRSLEHAARLADDIGGTAVASADEAIAEAGIICTATPATTPLFHASSIPDQVHINAVGAFIPEMVEIPRGVVERAFVVVDDRAAAAVEAGDLISASREPDADMTTLLEHGLPETGPLTLFKSVGIASQDVAAASTALANAAAMGVGTSIG